MMTGYGSPVPQHQADSKAAVTGHQWCGAATARPAGDQRGAAGPARNRAAAAAEAGQPDRAAALAGAAHSPPVH